MNNKKDKGFTLIEVMAAMLILSLAYVACLESFSSSLSQINKLDRHYNRLQQTEKNILATPLFFPTINSEDIAGETYIEGSKYKLILIKPESSFVETLILVQNQ